MGSAQAFVKEFRLHTDKLNKAAAEQLARMAREGEARIISDQRARKGIDPGHIEAVDGVQGRPFEEVKPGGMIVANFDYRSEIVAACFDELKARSPVVSGEYIKNHFCIIDGKGLPPLTVPTAAQVAAADRIYVTNPMHYARRLEVGLTEDGQPFVKQVDPHIFEAATEAVADVYGKSAYIWFTYIDLENAYVLKFDNARELRRRRKAYGNHRAGSAVQYPAILIRPL